MRLVCLLFVICLTIGCSAQAEDEVISRSEKAAKLWTPKLTHALATKDLQLGSSVFLRITKTQSIDNTAGKLEAFVENARGEFVLFKTWDICTYSGTLGPKLKEGDRQSPEGFYFVTPERLNPHSSYHLSFNLGYPNAYDRAHGRTGSYLMVHGDCVSIGCYAMTDEGIEEIYTLLQTALEGGQSFVRVHVFPFPMTESNMTAHSNNPNTEFWKNLKQGWDWFETHGQPPNVTVRNKTYVFGPDD